jgi:hypothetical protein
MSRALLLAGFQVTAIGRFWVTAEVSEAAVLFLKGNPKGQTLVARLEHRHGKGKALSILAHKLARAVYAMLRRQEAFDVNKFFKS